ncbi:hypothetical protein VOLCADRAFT_107597 [Volvox carteri f. nagariensis]|uniref:Thymidylate kinase n=1 Tax=Volvox carteri f. nagariensis TaxID=3068 RepID=D8UEW9_VOLCA|nr:uncharacterized protein VOLCADRAFT_107597 [Volvox carteri f. nagariensis]EFJ41757.1 hypothetical protein VOLCADRAFT_107597 [Volvox carteri f. nagariensis]|eukprot:XP_002957259.1 hypothetical protein VOLCADRAFT_107597 [Volvox carteri f. nagariensis]
MTSEVSYGQSSRGALIVFEGGDRCGKTTQCRKLVERLRSQGVDAVMWRFPDRSTSIGQAINAYLVEQSHMDDAVAHLLFAANRMEKREEMLRLLSGRTTLVVDRYSYSGVAYTAAKGVPHLSMDYCRAVEVGLPAADLVIFMDMTAEATAARGGYGQERYEKVDFQQKVMKAFEALRDERWAVIDASGTIDDIHQKVAAVAEPVVQRALAGSALGRLWDYKPIDLPTVVTAAGGQQSSFPDEKSAAAAGEADAVADVFIGEAEKMQQVRSRGAFIVFEGIDRCGKSTQSNLLVDHLRRRGVKVEHWCFPDRSTRIGQTINDYLHNGADHDDTAIHLLFTANRFEKRYSGVAYTAAKGVPHLSMDYCRAVEVGLPAADLVIFMDMTAEEAAARGGFGAERYEKLEFQRKASLGIVTGAWRRLVVTPAILMPLSCRPTKQVAQQYAALKDSHWLRLDATQQPECLQQQVVDAVLPVVEGAARGALLGRLWDYQPLELPVAVCSESYGLGKPSLQPASSTIAIHRIFKATVTVSQSLWRPLNKDHRGFG